MVTAYMTLLALFVGPVGLGWYLEGFEHISEQSLATLTITSPYSAAFSVPMHVNRNGSGLNVESLEIARMPIVPLSGGMGLPVFAIFLLVYPPLCLLLFGVTYLAFRIRWWRTGGT